MTFSSDIIVGFPGETEEDFEQTVELVKRMGYIQLFTFIFSKRNGTQAALLPDETPREVKAIRLNRLVDIQEEITLSKIASFKGQAYRVLVEGEGREDGQLTGRLDNNLLVEFAGDAALIGQFATVQITGSKGVYLQGTLQK